MGQAAQSVLLLEWFQGGAWRAALVRDPCNLNEQAVAERTARRFNKRLQLTAFGARDRAFFEVILCRASAAAEAQQVRAYIC